MYAKLSSTITRSSIWRESPATRCVWITLLACANEDGFVKGVEAWLAHEANVTREECREALRLFQAEDPESQDQDWGGRRIEWVEGGWIVLNYRKYRDMRTKEQVLAAERQHRKRMRDKQMESSADAAAAAVTGRHAASRSVTAIASASASESEGSAPARAREPRRDAAGATPAPTPAPDPTPPASAVSPPTPVPPRWAQLLERLDRELPGVDAALTLGDQLREIAATHVTRANALAAELEAIEQGLHGPPATLAQLAQAVHELRVAGESPRPQLLRAYVRRVQRGADGATAAGAAAVPGALGLTAAACWALCVRAGLTQPMLNRATVLEICARLARDGEVSDGDAFAALVLHLEPWALAEIKFGKAREEQLGARFASWRPPAPATPAGVGA